jgi:dynactin 1
VLIKIAEYEKPVGEAEEGKSSLAFVQLEKHNERLKEALIR